MAAGASPSVQSTTDAPGTLIAEQSVTATGVQAAAVDLVSYWSESVPNNLPVEVTGLVFVPKGTPPAGGWPVVSWAHYTDGTNGNCAPSRNPSTDVPFINNLLAQGWEVVATDYQGENNSQILSTSPGLLPYLVGESAARNTIDIVSAAGQLPAADASSNYVVWGWSEGGQTAMFVQDIASSYAPSLHLEGVLAMAPPSNFQTSIPSVESSSNWSLMYLLVGGYNAAYGNTAAPTSSILTAGGQADLFLLNTDCSAAIASAASSTTWSAVFQPAAGSWSALPTAWQTLLNENDPANPANLATTDTSVPLLIASGSDDTLVLPSTTAELATDLCGLTVPQDVERWVYTGLTHSNLESVASIGDFVAWTADRFAGDASGTYMPTGNATYPVTVTNICGASQAIAVVPSSSSTPWTNTVTLSSSGSSGIGAVSYSLDDGTNGNSSDAACSLSGTSLSASGSGDCWVDATIAGDTTYSSATSSDVEVVFTGSNLQEVTVVSSSTSTSWTNIVSLSSSGSSGTGAVSYSLDDGTNGNSSDAACWLSGTSLSASGSGDCWVDATIAGDTTYSSATSSDVEVVFTMADQAITVDPSSTSTSWANTVTLSSSGSLGTGAVGYSLDEGANGNSSDAVCALSGSSLSASGPGDCWVDATIAGDTNYDSATSSDLEVVFTTANQVITVVPSSTSTPWSNSVTLSSSGSAGTGAVGYSLDEGTNGNSSDAACSLSGTSLSASGPGDCWVDATIAGDANYDSATSSDVEVVFTGASSQAITVIPSATSAPWTNTVTLSSSGSPGTGAIGYSLDDGTNGNSSDAVCALAGTSLSASGPGDCWVDATIAGDANYDSATSSDVEVAFTNAFQAALTITSTSGTYGTPLTLTTSGGSGIGAVTYVVDSGDTGDTATGCSISSGGVLSSASAGTCLVTATKGADSDYDATSSAPITITLGPASQAITITSSPPSPAHYGGTYTVTATGGASGNALTFSSATSSVCVVSGSMVSLVGVGTCVIDTDQAGTASYNAAPQVQQSFTVSMAPQTITFSALANKTLAQSPVTLSATASSGLPVTFSATTPSVCTVSSTTLMMLNAGTCTVVASQAGNAVYADAASVWRSFWVSMAPQTITFSTLATKTLAQSPVTLSATASSGLPVTFSTTTPSVCAVSGTTLTMLNVGTCTVVASQAGNAVYAVAPSVWRSFWVSMEPQTITFSTLAKKTLAQSPVTLSATASSGLPVTFSTTTPSVCTVSGTTLTMLNAGTCTVVASQAGNAVYAAAPSVWRSFTVST
jgi:hypothetical protein